MRDIDKALFQSAMMIAAAVGLMVANVAWFAFVLAVN